MKNEPNPNPKIVIVGNTIHVTNYLFDTMQIHEYTNTTKYNLLVCKLEYVTVTFQTNGSNSPIPR